MRLVNGHDFYAILIKLQIRLRKDLFQCFNECAESSRLDSSDFKEVAVCVGLAGAHLMPGGIPSLARWTQLKVAAPCFAIPFAVYSTTC